MTAGLRRTVLVATSAGRAPWCGVLDDADYVVADAEPPAYGE